MCVRQCITFTRCGHFIYETAHCDKFKSGSGDCACRTSRENNDRDLCHKCLHPGTTPTPADTRAKQGGKDQKCLDDMRAGVVGDAVLKRKRVQSENQAPTPKIVLRTKHSNAQKDGSVKYDKKQWDAAAAGGQQNAKFGGQVIQDMISEAIAKVDNSPFQETSRKIAKARGYTLAATEQAIQAEHGNKSFAELEMKLSSATDEDRKKAHEKIHKMIAVSQAQQQMQLDDANTEMTRRMALYAKNQEETRQFLQETSQERTARHERERTKKFEDIEKKMAEPKRLEEGKAEQEKLLEMHRHNKRDGTPDFFEKATPKRFEREGAPEPGNDIDTKMWNVLAVDPAKRQEILRQANTETVGLDLDDVPVNYIEGEEDEVFSEDEEDRMLVEQEQLDRAITQSRQEYYATEPEGDGGDKDLQRAIALSLQENLPTQPDDDEDQDLEPGSTDAEVGEQRKELEEHKVHMRGGKGASAKRYSCPRAAEFNCHKTYRRSGDAALHSIVHSPEKAIKCSYEGCSRLFARRDHMESHLAAHYTTRRYPCPFANKYNCRKRFKRSDSAICHSKIHTAKRVPCSYEGCSKDFAREDNMTRHLKNVHHKDESSLVDIPIDDTEDEEEDGQESDSTEVEPGLSEADVGEQSMMLGN